MARGHQRSSFKKECTFLFFFFFSKKFKHTLLLWNYKDSKWLFKKEISIFGKFHMMLSFPLTNLWIYNGIKMELNHLQASGIWIELPFYLQVTEKRNNLPFNPGTMDLKSTGSLGWTGAAWNLCFAVDSLHPLSLCINKGQGTLFYPNNSYTSNNNNGNNNKRLLLMIMRIILVSSTVFASIWVAYDILASRSALP